MQETYIYERLIHHFYYHKSDSRYMLKCIDKDDKPFLGFIRYHFLGQMKEHQLPLNWIIV